MLFVASQMAKWLFFDLVQMCFGKHVGPACSEEYMKGQSGLRLPSYLSNYYEHNTYICYVGIQQEQ